MNIFDIVGPVMVGPSSSHTAGAVKIGYVARKLMGEEIVDAQILLYGSFLATGNGHGTKYAIVAEVSSMLAHKLVNVATLQLYRESRGGHAVMVLECDQEIPQEAIRWLEHLEGIEKVTYYSLLEGC